MKHSYPWVKSLQFAFSYGATLGASILVLPLILNNYPLAAWNAIAVGSSIGTFAAIIIEGGWGFAGPGLHQQIEDELSLKLLQKALRQKLFLLCAVLPIVIPVTWYISDKSLPELSVCVAVAFSTIGFNFTWIFVKSATGRSVLLLDAFPRLVITILMFVLLEFHGSIYFYPLSLLIANFTSAFLIFKLHKTKYYKLGSSNIIGKIHSYSTQFKMNLVIGAYSSVLIPAISILMTSQLASFSLLDRIQRTVAGGAAAFLSPLQFWIFRFKGNHQSITWINRLTIASSLIFGGVFVLIMPTITDWVFPKIHHIPITWWILSGLYFAVINANRVYAFSYLIPLGYIKFVYQRIIVAAISFVFFLFLIPLYGIKWALSAQLIREVYIFAELFRTSQKAGI